MSDQDEIPVERITKLKKPKAKDLVNSQYAAKGYSLKVLKHVEEVLARLYDDLQQYEEYQQNPDYGKIVSAYRSADRQKKIWEAAQKKYQDKPDMLDRLDDFVAKPGDKKITPHMTGAAMDFYLGKAIESENIAALKKSKVYDLFSRHAYHNYKLAPYSVEPWHWECGDACKQNIEQILLEEKATAQVVQSKNTRALSGRIRNALPPALPSNATQPDEKKNDTGDYQLTVEEIMEMEKEDNTQKNILKFLVGGSILLTTYLVAKKKR